jgi:hypothetical protein
VLFSIAVTGSASASASGAGIIDANFADNRNSTCTIGQSSDIPTGVSSVSGGTCPLTLDVEVDKSTGQACISSADNLTLEVQAAAGAGDYDPANGSGSVQGTIVLTAAPH